MKFKIKDCIINIEIMIVFLTVVSIFSKTFRSYMEMYYICFLFITFHEMAHVFMGIIFRKKVRNIKISICGLSVGFNKYSEEYINPIIKNIVDILIYLSGPFANYILAIIFKDIKFVYEINMAFFLINLMPIYPLDGYNIIKTVLNIIKNKKNRFLILKLITITFLLIFLLILLFYIIKYKNYNCVIFMLYILSLNITR